MKKLSASIWALCGLWAGAAGAQALPTAVPASQASYYNAQGRLVAHADSADHREEMVFQSPAGGQLRIYYPSGRLRREVAYLDFTQRIKQGPETSYYETGEVKSRCRYQNDVPVEPYVQYYRSGSVRCRTNLKSGFFGNSGVAFTPEGKPLKYDRQTQVKPTLNGGGDQVIVAAVASRVSYPPDALLQQKSGRVFATFLVDDAGFVRNVRILKSPSPLFNATVLDAVRALGRFEPGKMLGEPVDIFFTIPVSFKLQ
ncbi:TonB family protein [Hymenobacter sp. DH14]|uniref:TonB family protein n=1 Tax=Hymenobacter cyanobacteriorum TaxID=2926463 RepID=A0A9X1VGA9_9BACT|nr:energy transducer TonB [Hymenobacter cyanobacteriorum]MCI1187593.1 TonB family protein [Hymenobacter cyanobacteriorum]